MDENFEYLGNLPWEGTLEKGIYRCTQINSHVIFSVLKPSVTRWQGGRHRPFTGGCTACGSGGTGGACTRCLEEGRKKSQFLTNMFLQLAFWNHHLVDHILKCLFLTGGAIDQVPKSNCGQSQCMTRWWFSKIFIFTPTLGKDPIWIWRAYFSIGLVQPPTRGWNETTN